MFDFTGPLSQAWYQHGTRECFVKSRGVGPKRVKGGVFSQFPEVDWREDLDAFMEQICAVDHGWTECPRARFKVVTELVPA